VDNVRSPRWIRVISVAVAMVAASVTVVSRGADAGHRQPAQVLHLTSSANVAVTTTSTFSSTSALVGLVYHRISVYKAPGGAFLRYMSARTPLGSLRTLLVMQKRSDGWLQVQLPVRPNGTKAWIRTSSVVLDPIPMRIVVNRSTRTLTLFRDGLRVARFPVAVGKPSTPTPTGLFWVIDKLPTGNPGGAFGPYALGLSGYSNVLLSFDGGDGVVGIHGTNATSSVGHPVTHGCIRLYNRDVTRLYRLIWLGTPVQVR
jgi:lipoprotein-anchoring transpeptidase ErfK/SrfK